MAYRRILVPVDGSETSNAALAAALRMARESDGKVLLLHGVDALQYLSGFEMSALALQDAMDYASRVVEEAKGAAYAAGVPADSLLVQPMVEGLGAVVAREAGQWKADLVVVGSHGRRGLERFVLGSGAEEIIREAPVPVLVIRAGGGARP